MSISLLLEMAASSNPDRIAVVSSDLRLTTQQLSDLADGGAGVIAASNAGHVAYVGTGGVMLPLLIFSSARAGRAFTPVNYRLSAEGVQALIDRLPEPLVIVDEPYRDIVAPAKHQLLSSDEFLTAARNAEPLVDFPDPNSVAIVLFTSGTTSLPKAVELSHHNLTSYVTGTVEFDSAEPTDAALICVPPYHIAGVGAALSNLYAGRKMVLSDQFRRRRSGCGWSTTKPSPPRRWCPPCSTVSSPCSIAAGTTCARCATWLTAAPRWGLPLIRRALELLPGVGFVNAYGLTETSSTVAVLTPEDHWAARAAADVNAVKRLASVGPARARHRSADPRRGRQRARARRNR